jgi:cation diffusion facilitator family transporter
VIPLDDSKFKKISQVLWVILFANLFVATAKIILGSVIKSASVTADGFHSLADSSSNIVGLIGIGIASKPIDEDHPYGHRKFETLTSLFIVGMLLYIGVKIIAGSVQKFMNPEIPEISEITLIIMLITLGINIFVSTFEHRKGKELNSMILISDSMHTRSDIFISLGVITTLVALKLGAPPIIDPLASIIVSFFILHAAYRIYKEASGILVDSAAIDEKIITDVVLSHKRVFGVHKIRSRGSMDIIHIDMHVLADPELSLREAHDLAHDIEVHLQKEIDSKIDVLVHLEPFEERD